MRVFPTAMSPAHLRRRMPAAAAAALLLAAASGAAQAASWAPAGGDAGRAGSSPVDAGTAPAVAVYAKTAATDTQIRTPPLITDGPSPAFQRIAYGTANGRVHLQNLQTGAPVGPEAGADIDEGVADPAAFGAAGAGIGFADTSATASVGQLYAVHNDTDQDGGTDDIAIAQIDGTSGLVVQDLPVAGTAGFAVAGTPAVTEAATNADPRTLLFLASDGVVARLFRIPITAAGTVDASLGAATSTVVPGATPGTSPALVTLRTPASGAAELYAAIGAGVADGVVTRRASDLAAGPTSGPLGGAAQTPSAPLDAFGMAPGTPGGTVPVSSTLTVAVQTGVASTTVRRLAQIEASPLLTSTGASPALSGAPAPGLATSQASVSGGASGGAIAVGTAANLHLLDGNTLAPRGALSAADFPAGTGFGKSAPSLSGPLVFASADDGRPAAAATDTGAALGSGEFAAQPGSAGATAPAGQPAISAGYVAFASDRGLFVHRTKDVTAPTVVLDAPGPRARVAGLAKFTARVADQRGIAAVEFRLNNKLIGTAARPTAGTEQAPGGAAFTVEYDTRKLPSNKTYYYVVTARDTAGLTKQSVTRRIVIVNPATRRLKPGRCANTLRGSNSEDVLGGTTLGDALYGRNGDDVLTGVQGADCLYGAAGADALAGGTASDLLSGWTGDDVLLGGSGNDSILGGSGNDVLRGHGNVDRLDGGAGNDALDGGTSNDRLLGGSGNDRLVGGAGTDGMYGQAGSDTVDAADGRRETVDCGAGRDIARVDRTDRVRGCERVTRRR